jgi:hypothetical protein
MTVFGEYTALPGVVAGASLTTKQFTPVLMSSTAARTVLSCTVTTRNVVGILMNNPASGEPADVAILGNVKAVAGTATLLRGARLTCNSTGVIPSTTDNQFVFAQAIDAAVAKGDLIMINVLGPSRY